MFSKENNYYVYGLIDPITNQIRYIGVTYRPKRRLQDHIFNSRKMKTHRDKWINSLLKSNIFPKLEILETIKREEIEEAECFWISYFKSLGANLTNATSGGEGVSGLSLETREKIRSKLKGRKPQPLTDRGREKIRETATNLIRDAKFCKKISDAKKGQKFSEKHKYKLSQAKIGKKRKPFTEETLQKMREAQNWEKQKKRRKQKVSVS